MSNDAPRRRELTIEQYCEGILRSDVTTLARALTLVESNRDADERFAEGLLNRLLPHTGGAIRVGVTGAPGVGKSTFIEALGMLLVEQGKRVAVLAVDPSSSVSGGSILADKTRMTRLAGQASAFVRPSPSAGTLGGIARKTQECSLVCEAAGFDVILIETVGVGQSETVVAGMTDLFLALILPAGGDELQGMKRGLLELVDVIAVNKADGLLLASAELTTRQYASAMEAIRGVDTAPTVLSCSALNNEGVDRVWSALVKKFEERRTDGTLRQQRGQQRLKWLWSVVDERLLDAIGRHPAVRSIRAELENGVLDGTVTPEAAARKILDAFGVH